MLRLREILRSSKIARLFIHLFIYNFFTCQCFAMMPAEVLVDNFRSNIRSLFSTFNEIEDNLGLVLTREDKTNRYSLEAIKINGFGESVTHELSSEISHNEHTGEDTLDFGFGFMFSIINGALCFNQDLNGFSGYFQTNTDVLISNVHFNKSFLISANVIQVQNELSTGNALTLACHRLLNEGMIFSPFLSVRASNLENAGSILGSRVIIESDNMSCKEKSSINGSEVLDITSREKIECNNSSLTGKNSRIRSSQMKVTHGSEVFGRESIDCSGNEIFIDRDSRVGASKNAKFMSYLFHNGGQVLAAERLDVFASIFLNEGIITTKKTDIFVTKENALFGPPSLSRTIEVFEYIFPDKRLGSFANIGEINAYILSVVAERYLLNRGVLSAYTSLDLSGESGFANEGHIIQTGLMKNSHCQIFSQGSILNKDGTINIAGHLMIDGESFDNTHGTLKAKQLKMRLALGEEDKFRENEKEQINLQSEANSHSERVQEYLRMNRSPCKPKSTSSDGDKTSTQDSGDTSGKEGDGKSKRLTPETGYLVNTGGVIEVLRNLDINGSGALYNAEGGRITAKDNISMNIYGRLLNQIGSKIAAHSMTVRSQGRVFNTGGSVMEGLLSFHSDGFENGIGSKVLGSLGIVSHTSIYNFGEIISIENPLQMVTDFTLKNYGTILSNGSIVIEAEELSNAGKIEGAGIERSNIDFSKVRKFSNNQEGSIEAKKGGIYFKKGVTFSNSGRITAQNLALENVQLCDLVDSRSVNSGGLIEARDTLTLSTNQPVSHIKGIIKAPNFTFVNNSRGTIKLNDILLGAGIQVDNAVFRFPNARLENREDTVLGFRTEIFANQFLNLAVLQGLYGLKIHTTIRLENGRALLCEYPDFLLGNDWDIEHNEALLSSVKIPNPAIPERDTIAVDLAPDKRHGTAIITADEGLELTSEGLIKNTGTIQTKGHLTLSASQLQHGWAYESVHHESLPEIEFDYDFMEAQPSYIRAGQGAEITVGKFLNTFGIIDIVGGLVSNNTAVFLNYAGDINVHGEAQITTPLFANLIGTVKTRRTDKRYWSLEFCNTNPASFNVLGGRLSIDSPHAINSGSFLYGQDGVLLNGVAADQLVSVFDIASQGFGYTRMYSVNEYNRGQYADRILGMGYTLTGFGAIIRAELNETVRKKVLPATVSSSKKVVIDGYKDLRSDGIIHGASIGIKTGDGTTELGYTGEAILPSITGFAKSVEVYPYISSMAQEGQFELADETGSFLFKSRAGGMKIPFTIIGDDKTDYSKFKLPFSLEVLEVMALKQMQKTLGTGYLPDMPTFLDAAKVAHGLVDGGREATGFPFLRDYTEEPTKIISEDQATHGLFFRVQKIGDYDVLVPRS